MPYLVSAFLWSRNFKEDKSNKNMNDKGVKHSLVILIFRTKSDFDRSLPRGVHPPPPMPLLRNVTQNALEGQNIAIPALGKLNETTSFTTTPQQDVQSS